MDILHLACGIPDPSVFTYVLLHIFVLTLQEHITRICRIIQRPSGNAMLIGVGGSGKQSLSRLAAFICGFEVRQLSVTSKFKVRAMVGMLVLETIVTAQWLMPLGKRGRSRLLKIDTRYCLRWVCLPVSVFDEPLVLLLRAIVTTWYPFTQ